jgi:hypothetical protein
MIYLPICLYLCICACCEQFLASSSQSRITFDQWDSFLQFNELVALDLSNYEDDGACKLNSSFTCCAVLCCRMGGDVLCSALLCWLPGVIMRVMGVAYLCCALVWCGVVWCGVVWCGVVCLCYLSVLM